MLLIVAEISNTKHGFHDDTVWIMIALNRSMNRSWFIKVQQIDVNSILNTYKKRDPNHIAKYRKSELKHIYYDWNLIRRMLFIDWLINWLLDWLLLLIAEL